MPFLSEFTKYKKMIAKAICEDADCVSLITNTNNHAVPAYDLIESVNEAGNRHRGQVHLYDFLPGTEEVGEVHVCVEIEESRVVNGAVANFEIHIYVIVPENLMVMYGQIRRDALASAIDKVLNGRTDFGFGKLERMLSDGNFLAVNKWRGRELVYGNPDYNRIGARI
jgi:hypothetical protein